MRSFYWSTLQYEEQCFYHNSVTREKTRFANLLLCNTDESDAYPDNPELLNDYDSMAETWILRHHVRKCNNRMIDKDEAFLVQKLSRHITFHLNYYHMEKLTSVCLSFLRASPFNRSNPITTSQRKEWFELHRKTYEKLYAHFTDTLHEITILNV